jgi:hypothetical protein
MTPVESTLVKPLDAQALSDAQIQRLFDFCREHYVYYYDVQVELVDHMAEAIEAKLPSMGFEEALKDVYRSFGYNGFTRMLDARSKQLMAWNRKRAWAFFVRYFTWPKALLSVLIISVLYTLETLFPFTALKWVVGGAFALLMLMEILFRGWYWLRYRRPTTPLLLLAKTRWPAFFASAVICNLYLNIFKGFGFMDQKFVLTALSYNVFVVVFVVAVAIVLAGNDMRKQVYHMAREKYPDAFTVPDMA